MTMNLDGEQIASLKISTSTITDSTVELKDDMTDRAVYRPGQVFTPRAVPSGIVQVPGPANPELTVAFRTNVAMSKDWRELVRKTQMTPKTEYYFNLTYVDDVSISGRCYVRVDQVEHDLGTRVTTSGITMVRSSSDWDITEPTG